MREGGWHKNAVKKLMLKGGKGIEKLLCGMKKHFLQRKRCNFRKSGTKKRRGRAKQMQERFGEDNRWYKEIKKRGFLRYLGKGFRKRFQEKIRLDGGGQQDLDQETK